MNIEGTFRYFKVDRLDRKAMWKSLQKKMAAVKTVVNDLEPDLKNKYRGMRLFVRYMRANLDNLSDVCFFCYMHVMRDDFLAFDGLVRVRRKKRMGRFHEVR